ncbi:hypothetical protein ABZ707_30245 [Streptomyces sp. NPDC006923]|uniref:hypothetical protein n=1 Tax=Streptomyces sp. NPDC006923 TaxID=3155355 RepID=UPI0034014DF7
MSLPTLPVDKARTALDHRIEAAVGCSVDQLWQHRERGLLDKPSSRLADAHRGLVRAETSVTFYRFMLRRLASGRFPVNQALFARIDRTVGQLQKAATARDEHQQLVLAALGPVETMRAQKTIPEGAELSAPDFAALLAITQGAKLHYHLLTGRLSVVTASGVRVTPSTLERLEEAGLVTRDESHPVQAGQPVTVTNVGRTTLAGVRRPGIAAAPPSPQPGAWPIAGRARS